MEIAAELVSQLENVNLPVKVNEMLGGWELKNNIECGEKMITELPDISFIERTSRNALLEQCSHNSSELNLVNNKGKLGDMEIKAGLDEKDKIKIRDETDWSRQMIDCIKNMEQYEVLKNADLKEYTINGKPCLIKENIDFDYTDEDGISNKDRMERGLAPLDSKTEKPLELHHLGQRIDSPLVELTEEEHRTGEYKDGKKNQSLWHDNTIKTEVHGEGSNWDQERKAHWQTRAENSKR